MGTTSTPVEVITIDLDLTKHADGVTVVSTITTNAGTVVITVDPHRFG